MSIFKPNVESETPEQRAAEILKILGDMPIETVDHHERFAAVTRAVNFVNLQARGRAEDLINIIYTNERSHNVHSEASDVDDD